MEDTLKKNGQVQKAMLALDKAIEDLSVEEERNRYALVSVLATTQENKLKASEIITSEAVDILVPLAESLKTFCERVTEVTYRLKETTQRIEL